MRNFSSNEHAAALLLLLLILLILPSLGHLLGRAHPAPVEPDQRVFVQIAGAAAHPGVYGFVTAPLLGEVLSLGCETGDGRSARVGAPLAGTRCGSGTRVEVETVGSRQCVRVGRMSEFYAVTLGIPVSINRSSALGLTALPGIGPRTAAAIVERRLRRGGFQDLKQLLSVRGVGPGLYRKISPHVTL